MQKQVSGNTVCYASFAASAGPGRSGEEAGVLKTTFFLLCFFFFFPLLSSFLVLTAQAEETTNQILSSEL